LAREFNGMKHTMRHKPKDEFWWEVFRQEDLSEQLVGGS
jgi:hypothetical protein